MTIDWTHFTPWTALAGGILLGIASAAFILVNGRVLGISGILGGLLVPKRSDASWRVMFLLGLLLAPATLSLLAPGLIVPRASRLTTWPSWLPACWSVWARVMARAAPAATAFAACPVSLLVHWLPRWPLWPQVLPWSTSYVTCSEGVFHAPLF
jgi:hypothetical protein